MQRCSPRLALTLSAVPLAGMVLCASFAAPPAKSTRAAGSVAAPGPNVSDAVYRRDVLPVIDEYCVPCHTGDDASAGLSLSKDKDAASVLAHRDLWEKVAANIESKHMPPKGMPMPTDAQRARVLAFVQATLSQAVCDVKDPGRVTARRLNRAEYENTVRDLVGVSVPGLTEDFPSDDVGYGFDNIGDVLTLSPLQLEKYLAAAGRISRAVIAAPEDRRTAGETRRGPHVIAGDLLDGKAGGEPGTGNYTLYSNGDAGFRYEFPAPGRYLVKAVAWEQQAGPESAKMAFLLGETPVQTVDVSATEANPGTYEATLEVRKAGMRRVAVSFLNDYYRSEQDTPDPKLRGDRNLLIGSLEVRPLSAALVAPPTVAALSQAQQRLIRVLPANSSESAKTAATRKNLTTFLLRAYRRPATAAETDRLVNLASRVRGQGGSFERGMQVAVQAALVSPSFLFRIEQDPVSRDPRAKRPLTDYELATRLAYFLWSSMPDDRLLALASQKKLQDPITLQIEAKRMLRDPRAAQTLGDNFAAQWLQLRKLSQITPDTKRFPEFTDEVRSAMRSETLLYFQHVVGDDRSVLDFLDSNYTYLNEPLARLYGTAGVTGRQFRRVVLNGSQRGGVLTQASVLSVTSNPTRTSPVKRGRFVMENLLGSPIPMPPPGVGQLPDDNKRKVLEGTLRQRMEQHRSDPSCASCHARMDPIGFGLENYNAIGMWRKLDDGHLIDASGALPGGKPFSGPQQLRLALKAKAPQFTYNLSEKLLTYALGRGIESADRCNVDLIAQSVAKKNYRFSALVTAIVTSEPFRYRRADRPAAPAPRVASISATATATVTNAAAKAQEKNPHE
ncbi:MAG: DUF1592 domain-containing protein [Cytophagales bacterium]|nr:DUF1592 domain-containing protein [Armatimonadota bacterium]